MSEDLSQLPAELLSEKAVSFERLEQIALEARRVGRRVLLCHGVFDLLHSGHIRHFKAARRRGDFLMVTVTPDRFAQKAPGRPVFNQWLRMEHIAALECVNAVALNLWPTAEETIRRLRPHTYVKGCDYADPSLDVTGNIRHEVAAAQEVGAEVIYTDEAAFSSSALINRYFRTQPPDTEDFLQQFRSRHSAEELIGYLNRLADLHVVVVGEAIHDVYTYSIPLAKPPKETIIAAKFDSEESFAGGALAVANHVAGFCRDVTLLTLMGTDPAQAELLKSKLRPNVRLGAVWTAGRPTVMKRRYLDPNFLTKMFEIQYLDDRPLAPAFEEELLAQMQRWVPAADMLIVSDFGHGMITPALREQLAGSRQFLALNVQTNSANLGFNPVTQYRRADYVCLDEPELRLAARVRYGEIPAAVSEIRRQMAARHVLISLGPRGNVFFAEGGQELKTPVFSVRIVDRTGAGDALFAVTAPCLYTGCPPDVLGFIANCVGAIAVEVVCNREPVDPAVLRKFVTALLK